MRRPTPADIPEGATIAEYLACFPEEMHDHVRELYDGNTPEERGPAICRMWESVLSPHAYETECRQWEQPLRQREKMRRWWPDLKSAGGRPPVPDDQKQRLVHLRDHCSPRWPLAALAVKFLSPDVEYADPENTIRQRLRRARPYFPKGECADCQSGDFPLPPS